MSRIGDIASRMRERKLVQWAVAYLAGAWAFAEAFELVGGQFDWPLRLRQAVTILLGVGLLAALVIAWYHGEKGRQRVSGAELLALALLFAIAGLLIARFDTSETAASAVDVETAADTPVPRDRPTVAVLPFANLSDDPSDAYFTDGIHEEIIVRLSRVRGLDVIARTSVAQYRDHQGSASQIARELNATALLEGSVRRAGSRVRIVVELINADEGVTSWSGDWDRQVHPDSIFDVQEAIARSVASALDARLSSDEERRLATHPTHDLVAFDYYMLGRHRWATRSREDLHQALSLFEAAVDQDPAYAPAHAGIADIWAVLAWYDTVPPARAYPRAREAAHRAIELDPDLAEAHATLGLVAYEYEWAWQRAEDRFREAIDLRPNYAPVRHWYAVLLSNLGRHEDAVREGERALALDPLSTVIMADVAGILWTADSTERAIEMIDRALARESAPPPVVELERAIILLYESRWERAAASLERWARLVGFGDPAAAGQIALAPENPDRRPAALATLAAIERQNVASREDLIPLYALFGDLPTALDGVERAAATRNPWVVWMGTLPWYDRLRDELSFRALLERIGLPNGR